MLANLSRDEVERLSARYDELLKETIAMRLAAQTGKGPALGQRYERLARELQIVTLQLYAKKSSRLVATKS